MHRNRADRIAPERKTDPRAEEETLFPHSEARDTQGRQEKELPRKAGDSSVSSKRQQRRDPGAWRIGERAKDQDRTNEMRTRKAGQAGGGRISPLRKNFWGEKQNLCHTVFLSTLYQCEVIWVF